MKGLVCWIQIAQLLIPAIVIADEARDRAVEIVATVQSDWPVITLHWRGSELPIKKQEIYRRLKGDQLWGSPIAVLDSSEMSWIDGSALPKIVYEYAIVREFASSPGRAAGYIHAGYEIELPERGRAILIVEEAVAGALEAELERWRSDMVGDGWEVTTRTVSRDAAPPEVKEVIKEANDEGGSPARALVLFGRIPVPYSGDHAPDGHSPDHRGAWPADTYYADLDGEWNDATVDVTAADRLETRNVPGDGKFDASSLPSDVELELGRIDLSRMSIVDGDEVTLLRRYLDRNHDYRHLKDAYEEVSAAALIDDQFRSSVNPFAANGWRNFVPLVGSINVREGLWFEEMESQNYLFALASGPGTYTAIRGVGTSADFGEKPSRAVFNLFSGSYFGDWDVPDNFLRAPLAAGEPSLGLASVWTGRPDVLLFPMALGETLGYGVRLTQNNSGEPDSGFDAGDGVTARGTHIALMGDPTLRLNPVAPPRHLTVDLLRESGAALSWTASSDETVGSYLILRSANGAAWMRVADHISTTEYLDTTILPGRTYRYRVHAVKRVSGPSGSYWNSSQAEFASPVAVSESFWKGPRMHVFDQGRLMSVGADSAVTLQAVSSPEFDGAELQLKLCNIGIDSMTLVSPIEITGDSAAYYWTEPVLAEGTVLEPGAELQLTVRKDASVGDRSPVTVTVSTNDFLEPNFRFDLLPPPSVVVSAEDYYEWISTFDTIDPDLRSPDSDPDQDDILNSEEYAFGGMPDVPDATASLMPQIKRQIDDATGASILAITYRQLKDVTGNDGRGSLGRDYEIRDVRYIVELSDNGENWFAAGNEVIETQLPADNDDGTVTVVSKVNEIGTSQVPRLARVRVAVAERPLTYAIWLEGFPDIGPSHAAPLADADGDGLSNLGEYALGGDPTIPDMVPFAPKITDFDGRRNEISLSYRRRTSDRSGQTPGTAEDLTYTVEVSDDLKAWAPWSFGLQEVVEPTGDDFESVTVKVLEISDGEVAPIRFVRLRIGLGSQ